MIKKWMPDGEDGSVGKALATQSQGHDFNPQNPPKNAKHRGTHMKSQCWGGREDRIPVHSES